MSRTLWLIPVAFLLVGADVKDDAGKKELKKFEGSWLMVAGEHDGVKVSDENVKKSKIHWNGNHAVVETPHQSKDAIKAAIVKIDGTKKPAEMDWMRDNGPDAGKPMLAIYEFIDGDTYRICFAGGGKDRPKDFSTKAGSGRTVNTWKRLKK